MKIDHLGITVEDLSRARAQFDPVLTALGASRYDAEDRWTAWYVEGGPEVALYPAREVGSGPHHHGRVGWQHVAFAVDSRAEVDRLHVIALGAGWLPVREPKEYPRFAEHYYASFLEEDNGIRIELVYRPPVVAS